MTYNIFVAYAQERDEEIYCQHLSCLEERRIKRQIDEWITRGHGQ